jgi:hypothetical protein
MRELMLLLHFSLSTKKSWRPLVREQIPVS